MILIRRYRRWNRLLDGRLPTAQQVTYALHAFCRLRRRHCRNCKSPPSRICCEFHTDPLLLWTCYPPYYYLKIHLTLPDSPTVILKAGDTVVQRGTLHAWENPSETEWGRMAFVVSEGKEIVLEGGKKVEGFRME